MDLISSWTTLPNAHPALVHFPIALLPAALLLELIGLLRPRPWWPSRAATALLILAAVAGFFAYEAGEEAANGMPAISAEAQTSLEHHDRTAGWALRLMILALILRIAVAVHGRSLTSWNRSERALSALVTALAVVWVFWAADLGGHLVYHHGLGVRPAATVAAPVSPVDGGD